MLNQNNKSPTVSVIIATYNRATMVKEAIESVLKQTYRDFEIIVVDDGSTDNTRKTVTALSDKIVYVYQQNRGRSNARNHGISLTRGKYIAFLDSDDLFLPDKLAKQFEAMEKRPEILLSHTSYQYVDYGGNYIKEMKSGRFSGSVYPKIIRRCPIATPTVMLRREALKNGLCFKEGITIGEDIILWTQIARNSCILGINEVLAKVRVGGESAATDSQAQITGITNILEYTVKQEAGMKPGLRRNLLADGYLKTGFHHLRKGAASSFLKYIRLALKSSPLYVIYWIPTTLFTELFSRRWLWRDARLTNKSG